LRRSSLEVVADSAVAELEVESDVATGQASRMAVELEAVLMDLAQEPGPTTARAESSQTVRMKSPRHPEAPMALPPQAIPKQQNP
jgi:hypothetical protein